MLVWSSQQIIMMHTHSNRLRISSMHQLAHIQPGMLQAPEPEEKDRHAMVQERGFVCLHVMKNH